MKPLKPQELYRLTAEKLNLPEAYIKDVVEYYYMENKTEMFKLSHVIYVFKGLGRLRIRPLKFFSREKMLLALIDKFQFRRDNRGISILTQLKNRYEDMQIIKPEVQKMFDQIEEKRYGKNKKNMAK